MSKDEEDKNLVSTTSGKRGRPSKKALDATKSLTKREQAAALKEFRQRMLLNPKSQAVLEKILDTALDDDAKQQGVCMKIVADRILPAAGFSMENAKGSPSVSISITGIGTDNGVTINGSDGAVEGEYEDVDDE